MCTNKDSAFLWQTQASIRSALCGNKFSSWSSSIRRSSLCGLAVLDVKGLPRVLDPLVLRRVRPCLTRGVTYAADERRRVPVTVLVVDPVNTFCVAGVSAW